MEIEFSEKPTLLPRGRKRLSEVMIGSLSFSITSYPFDHRC
jgi:hypothetical protein